MNQVDSVLDTGVMNDDLEALLQGAGCSDRSVDLLVDMYDDAFTCMAGNMETYDTPTDEDALEACANTTAGARVNAIFTNARTCDTADNHDIDDGCAADTVVALDQCVTDGDACTAETNATCTPATVAEMNTCYALYETCTPDDRSGCSDIVDGQYALDQSTSVLIDACLDHAEDCWNSDASDLSNCTSAAATQITDCMAGEDTCEGSCPVEALVNDVCYGYNGWIAMPLYWHTTEPDAYVVGASNASNPFQSVYNASASLYLWPTWDGDLAPPFPGGVVEYSCNATCLANNWVQNLNETRPSWWSPNPYTYDYRWGCWTDGSVKSLECALDGAQCGVFASGGSGYENCTEQTHQSMARCYSEGTACANGELQFCEDAHIADARQCYTDSDTCMGYIPYVLGGYISDYNLTTCTLDTFLAIYEVNGEVANCTAYIFDGEEELRDYCDNTTLAAVEGGKFCKPEFGGAKCRSYFEAKTQYADRVNDCPDTLLAAVDEWCGDGDDTEKPVDYVIVMDILVDLAYVFTANEISDAEDELTNVLGSALGCGTCSVVTIADVKVNGGATYHITAEVDNEFLISVISLFSDDAPGSHPMFDAIIGMDATDQFRATIAIAISRVLPSDQTSTGYEEMVASVRFVTESPTTNPTAAPTTSSPTTKFPTATPTSAPTVGPTGGPTSAPTTVAPTAFGVTYSPTEAPTTKEPTESPTTKEPTDAPTNSPTREVYVSQTVEYDERLSEADQAILSETTCDEYFAACEACQTYPECVTTEFITDLDNGRRLLNFLAEYMIQIMPGAGASVEERMSVDQELTEILETFEEKFVVALQNVALPEPTEIPQPVKGAAPPPTFQPTMSPTTRAPTVDGQTFSPTKAPSTGSPTTRRPTRAPTTDAPTIATKAPTMTTEAPTMATQAPNVAPTNPPTESPTTKELTDAPTEPPSTASPPSTTSPREEDAPAPTILFSSGPRIVPSLLSFLSFFLSLFFL